MYNLKKLSRVFMATSATAAAALNAASARRNQLCRCGFHCYKWDWRRLGRYCQYCGRKKRKLNLTHEDD